jgi:MFS transporter, DHA2 family, multidrug resistance protein
MRRPRLPSSPSNVNDNVQSELTKSFSSAADTATKYPQYASQIIAGAQKSFLDGADWAYMAGMIAVVATALLVFFFFPRRDRERELLARYDEEDAAPATSSSVATAQP